MLAQRRPDEQVNVGPKSVSNIGPTESTTEKLRWPNVVMLSEVSLKNLCNKVYEIQNSKEILCINLRKSLEIQTSIFSNVL